MRRFSKLALGSTVVLSDPPGSLMRPIGRVRGELDRLKPRRRYAWSSGEGIHAGHIRRSAEFHAEAVRLGRYQPESNRSVHGDRNLARGAVPEDRHVSEKSR
jgi:hypothetical protein